MFNTYVSITSRLSGVAWQWCIVWILRCISDEWLRWRGPSTCSGARCDSSTACTGTGHRLYRRWLQSKKKSLIILTLNCSLQIILCFEITLERNNICYLQLNLNITMLFQKVLDIYLKMCGLPRETVAYFFRFQYPYY